MKSVKFSDYEKVKENSMYTLIKRKVTEKDNLNSGIGSNYRGMLHTVMRIEFNNTTAAGRQALYINEDNMLYYDDQDQLMLMRIVEQ